MKRLHPSSLLLPLPPPLPPIAQNISKEEKYWKPQKHREICTLRFLALFAQPLCFSTCVPYNVLLSFPEPQPMSSCTCHGF